MQKWANLNGDQGYLIKARERSFRVIDHLLNHFLDETDRWSLWVPVLFALGIGLYFMQRSEPSLEFSLSVGLLPALCSFAFRRKTHGRAFAGTRQHLITMVTIISLSIIAAGFSVAKIRTEAVRKPVLQKEMGPIDISGYVTSAEPMEKGGWRIVLRTLSIPSIDKELQPYNLRISIRQKNIDIHPDTYVRLRAVIRPPPPPSTPWSFDFPRMAWYAQIGAVGYAVSDILEFDGHEAEKSTQHKLSFDNIDTIKPAVGQIGIFTRWNAQLSRVRLNLLKRVQTTLTGENGRIASALMTGYRRHISEDSLEALRISGLAHILAISGLHMALAGGLFYASFRRILSCVPAISLNHSTKKWAAYAGLAGSLAYFLLSGASPATQRAFIMTVLLFVAIILDRPAITLRTLAAAAMVILVLRPESLVNISFQMSFAALVALVSFYEYFRQRRYRLDNEYRPFRKTLVRKFVIYGLGLCTTSLVAELATGVIGSYHFNRYGIYGLFANLAVMPVFGFIIMPSVLAALILIPVGLERYALQPMGTAIDWVLQVSHNVSQWPAAEQPVSQIPTLSILILVLAALWLCLWRKSWRLYSLGLVPVAFVIAQCQKEPELFVQKTADNFAIRTQTNEVYVLYPNRSKFDQQQWRQISGLHTSVREETKSSHASISKQTPFLCDDLGCTAVVDGIWTVAYAQDVRAFFEDCFKADIIISSLSMPQSLEAQCRQNVLIIDKEKMNQSGALAMFFGATKPRIVSAQDRRGNRPWTMPSTSNKKNHNNKIKKNKTLTDENELRKPPKSKVKA